MLYVYSSRLPTVETEHVKLSSPIYHLADSETDGIPNKAYSN